MCISLYLSLSFLLYGLFRLLPYGATCFFLPPIFFCVYVMRKCARGKQCIHTHTEVIFVFFFVTVLCLLSSGAIVASNFYSSHRPLRHFILCARWKYVGPVVIFNEIYIQAYKQGTQQHTSFEWMGYWGWVISRLSRFTLIYEVYTPMYVPISINDMRLKKKKRIPMFCSFSFSSLFFLVSTALEDNIPFP